jgi:iron complex outermembrane receptor protein
MYNVFDGDSAISKNKFRITLSFLILVYAGTNVASQKNDVLLELPLDQLVNVHIESASRFQQKATQAPSSVEILTSDDIRKFGWRNLADALNAVRGLYVRNDRAYSFLGNRGFSRSGDYNSRMLVMIDGRRMNEAIFDTAFIGEEFMLDMNLIDRIEYVPGAGSSVYGANAILGIINVITKSGKDFDGVHVSGEGGSLDTYRARMTAGKKWDNGIDVLLNASKYFSHGADKLYFPEFSDTNGGIADDMDLERNERLFGKISYQDIALRGGYVSRYKRVPTASFETAFNVKDNFNVDRQAYLDLAVNKDLTDDLKLNARTFYHWYDYYAVAPYYLEDALVYNYEATHAQWWGSELRFTGTQFRNHKWIAGLEFQYDLKQQQKSHDISPFYNYYDVNLSGWRSGIFVQDEYRFFENFVINAGLRLDQHHLLTSPQINPRVALIWNVTPALTSKFIYSSAFRAPNAFEYDFDRESFNGKHNPLNREERIKTYEFVTEWYPEKNWKILGTLFHNDFDKVLTFNNDTYTFLNTGRFKTYGLELETEKKWDNGRLFKLSWSHLFTRDNTLSPGVWATDSPKNMVKVHYSEPIFNNLFSLGFEELFVDQRRTFASKIAPGYHLFNANVALAKPYHGFQASLGIYNVFDQRYKVVAGEDHIQDTLAADGRTVRFRFDYGF